MIDDVRKGANEDEFRDLNERLEKRALSRSRSDGRFEIICECNREECTARIEISFLEYEAVRGSPTAFMLVPGHEDPSCERVVSLTETFEVVEKFGEAAIEAEVHSPRNEERPDT